MNKKKIDDEWFPECTKRERVEGTTSLRLGPRKRKSITFAMFYWSACQRVQIEGKIWISMGDMSTNLRAFFFKLPQ
jgi:hypothetical protein